MGQLCLSLLAAGRLILLAAGRLILLAAGCCDLGFGVEFFLVVVALSVFAKLLPLSLHGWKAMVDLDPLFHCERTMVFLLNICFNYKANIQLAFR